MEFETLYKRTKTGKIQYWSIVAADSLDGYSYIMKESGQLGTKSPLQHNEHISKGKNIGKANETTHLQQAEAQALSDWTRKKDEGYKTYADIMVSTTGGEYFAYKDVDKTNPERAFKDLEHCMPEFNSDSNGNLKPMKAPSEPWKPGKKLKLQFPLLCEPKLDGNRAFLTITESGTGAFSSSSGKLITTLDHLLSIVKQSKLITMPGVYDGEVYCHGMSLNQINSAIKKVRESTLKLNFHIFDMPMLALRQDLRTFKAREAAQSINHSKFPVVDNVIVQNEQEIIAHHDRWIEEGYEGAMLKEPNGTYQPGQRSSYWVKVKMFDDAEFKAIGYELGQRGVQDLTFICECEKGTFNATMNGSIADKQELYDKIDTLIGKMLTVKYFGFTDYGIPNLPKGKAFREE